MGAERILAVGINHLGASVALRERLAVAWDEADGALRSLRAAAELDEAVLLSTCSRVEVYAAASDPRLAGSRVLEWFESRAPSPRIACRRGPDAVLHAFRVTAGLDSWILGEGEIQGQVKKAYALALEGRHSGRLLNRVFQKALAAGKAVRAQTGIQGGVHSIGGAAALLAGRIVGEADPRPLILFGAGQASCAVARHLAAKRLGPILVANRTLERARELADSVGGTAVGFAEGMSRLGEAAIAVFSASSSGALLDAAALAPMVRDRRAPLFLIDLGVPRNVSPECGRLEGARLYDLDDLQAIVADSMKSKAAAKEQAEALVQAAARDCLLELRQGELRLAAAPEGAVPA